MTLEGRLDAAPPKFSMSAVSSLNPAPICDAESEFDVQGRRGALPAAPAGRADVLIRRHCADDRGRRDFLKEFTRSWLLEQVDFDNSY